MSCVQDTNLAGHSRVRQARPADGATSHWARRVAEAPRVAPKHSVSAAAPSTGAESSGMDGDAGVGCAAVPVAARWPSRPGPREAAVPRRGALPVSWPCLYAPAPVGRKPATDGTATSPKYRVISTRISVWLAQSLLSPSERPGGRVGARQRCPDLTSRQWR